jgi:type II secretory pathway pseudopilin PulG
MKVTPRRHSTHSQNAGFPCNHGYSVIAWGMTILELSIVIMVLLSLIGLTFIGAKTWKKGSDRATCLMNLERVQKGVRSLSNLYGYDPGTTVPGLQARVIGHDLFVESTPTCPAGGEYSYTGDGDLIPLIGSLYMTCSLSEVDDHVPSTISDW